MKEFWSQQGNKVTKRKAMKFHDCSECHGDIYPNEEYYSIRAKGDWRDWHTVKICEKCWEGNRLSSDNIRNYAKNGD